MVSAERHMKAMEKINALVCVRERNCKEIRVRLAKCGFDDEETEDAIETALRCGLVDEERYTRAYIRGKTALGWGRKKIEMRLRQEDIADEVIQACSEEFASSDEEFAAALRSLQKKPSNSKDPYASYVRRLVGKGYGYDVACKAASICVRGS